MRNINWGLILVFVIGIAFWVGVIFWLSGCTVYSIEFKDANGVSRAKLNMRYLLQGKHFDEASFDPNSNKILIKNYRSESEIAQVVKILLEEIIE